MAKADPQAPHLEKGKTWEDEALRFLESQGLILLERNFNCRSGEIDLIMMHKKDLVFVEVRYRSNDIFGGAAQSVGKQKQGKLRLAAQTYLQKNENLTFSGCRFDVLAIDSKQGNIHMDWISDAF